MATKMQKNYIDYKNTTIEKPEQNNIQKQATFKANPYYNASYNLKI